MWSCKNLLAWPYASLIMNDCDHDMFFFPKSRIDENGGKVLLFITKIQPRSSVSLWLDPIQKMGIDIISWRQRIGAYTPRSVTSPTRHTVSQTKPTSRNRARHKEKQPRYKFCLHMFIIHSHLRWNIPLSPAANDPPNSKKYRGLQIWRSSDLW